LRKIYILILVNTLFAGLNGQFADTTNFINGLNHNADTILRNTKDFYLFPESGREKSDAFYDSLKNFAGAKKWSSQLHNLLVKNNSPANEKSTNGFDRVAYFEKYSQKYIRNITIKQIDVFGPSISDTSRKAITWSAKMGNSLHITTSKSAIYKNLFISENERIDPYKLADNERILRNIPSFQDARIIVAPVENNTDSVDIVVLTKDVWPVALGVEIFDVSYGKIGLWNNNFLGLGHMFSFTSMYNFNKVPEYGYRAAYRIPNIGSTFTVLDLRHDDIWDYKANKINLSRDFVTPEIQFGGGISYEKVDQVKSVVTIDTIFFGDNTEFEYYNAWAGYSLPLKRVVDFRLRKSFFVTIRSQQYNFIKRPEIDTFFLYDFHNRRINLLSTGWVWQGYQSTNLLYGFGDTEDLPYGCMIKSTFGKESSEFDDRFYIGFSFAAAKYLHRAGYFSHLLDLGSYYNSKMEQGTINYRFQYFSPLFGNKKHKFRQFARIQYMQGYNRFDDEYIDLQFDKGIRGLDYNVLKGDKRLFFSTETVYYSPHFLYGFRFVYFLFFDGGVINYKNNALFDNQMFSSLGIGFRFRNERLVFNTIQFRACIFPFTNGVPAENRQNIDLSSASKFRLPEFANKIPSTVEY
jgi:hypothetical protein